jgi:hypothetical protein
MRRHNIFLNEGFVQLPSLFDQKKIKKLRLEAGKSRKFKNIFMSKKNFFKKSIICSYQPNAR